MAEWYVRDKKAPRGPLSIQQIAVLLHYGSITLRDVAWRGGMAEWLAIESTPEIVQFIAAAPPPRQRDAVVPDDPGPFHHVGNGMYLFKMQWKARIIASPRAFYIAKISEVLPYPLLGRFALLIIDGLNANDPAHDARSCVMSMLPESIRSQFMAKEDMSTCDVIVVPKAAVTCVAMTLVNTRVGLQFGSFEITVSANPLGGARRFLEQNGWKLDQELLPTELLLLPRPRNISVKRRLLWLALGIVALFAIVTVADWLSTRF